MKILITSQTAELSGQVDPHFGRASYYILYDTGNDDWEVLNNDKNRNAIQGAGIQAAENVARTGAEFVLTGHCGPKAFMTLSANGIQIVVGIEGKVADVIERFKRGEYKPTKQSDVPGHWG